MYRNNNAMDSGACSSFQVCDSVSGTCSFQNLPDTYTHVSGGTRNRKRRSWRWKALEDVPVVVQERSSEGKAKEGLKIVWRLSSRRRVFDSTCTQGLMFVKYVFMYVSR